eukprot:GFYU01064586.1.p2 GENE.GFYU01064586.1~~GFYU01064586.1.p2  ORF type:complete len:117 (-),score=21.04 GFYU01064586.1:546-896(-)
MLVQMVVKLLRPRWSRQYIEKIIADKIPDAVVLKDAPLIRKRDYGEVVAVIQTSPKYLPSGNEDSATQRHLSNVILPIVTSTYYKVCCLCTVLHVADVIVVAAASWSRTVFGIDGH